MKLLSAKKPKKEKEKKKFLEKTWLSPLLAVVIVLVISTIVIVPMCSNYNKQVGKYATLSKELLTEISLDELIEQSKVLNDADKTLFQEKTNEFVENKNLSPIFSLNGSFLKQNLNPQDLNFKKQSIMLNEKDLGCFLNSLLGAGWLYDFFDSQTNKSFLSVVGIKEFSTLSSGKTNFCVVVKFGLKSMIENSESKTSMETKLDFIPENIYFTFNATFDSDHIYEAELHVNKLSKESEQLFLELFFNLFDTTSSDVLDKIRDIAKNVLNDLDLLDERYQLSHNFFGKYLIFEKNNIKIT